MTETRIYVIRNFVDNPVVSHPDTEQGRFCGAGKLFAPIRAGIVGQREDGGINRQRKPPVGPRQFGQPLLGRGQDVDLKHGLLSPELEGRSEFLIRDGLIPLLQRFPDRRQIDAIFQFL
jgi:hypothetical protein